MLLCCRQSISENSRKYHTASDDVQLKVSNRGFSLGRTCVQRLMLVHGSNNDSCYVCTDL